MTATLSLTKVHSVSFEIDPEKTYACINKTIVRPFNNFLESGTLLYKIVELSLYILIFISKVVTKGFGLIGRACQVVLSYTGILCIKYMLEDSAKALRDLAISIKEFDFWGALHSTLRVFFAVVDTGLLIGNFVACLIGLGGGILLTKRIFAIMMPFGLASFWAYMGNQFINFVYNPILTKRITQQLNDPAQKKSNLLAIRHFATLLHPHWRANTNVEWPRAPERTQARVWLRQLDSWSRNNFQQELKQLEKTSWDPLSEIDEEKAEKLMEGIRMSFKSSGFICNVDWSIFLLGYGARMIGRAYPDTAQSWGARLGISVIYFGKEIVRRCQERQLKKQIKL